MMDKKIKIVSLFGYYNYGNRLQNFAMQEVLKNYNYDVETYNYIGFDKTRSVLLKKRKKSFKEWSLKYIKETNNLKNCDLICIGSDQILTHKVSFMRDLNFLKNSKNKFMYAASFGRANIPIKFQKVYSEGLKSFKYSSIREEKGCELFKQLTGKKTKQHVDPTLLLNKKHYDKCIQDYEIDNNFILTYFLTKPSILIEKYLHKLSFQMNFKKFNLNQELNYAVNPGQFLSLVFQSKLIVTDSYHGVLFSIIYEKPFIYIENRPKMASRMMSLVKTFPDLKSRMYENIKNTKLEDIFSFDYKKTNEILQIQKINSHNYLSNILL